MCVPTAADADADWRSAPSSPAAPRDRTYHEIPQKVPRAALVEQFRRTRILPEVAVDLSAPHELTLQVRIVRPKQTPMPCYGSRSTINGSGSVLMSRFPGPSEAGSLERCQLDGGQVTSTREQHFETVFAPDGVRIYVYTAGQSPMIVGKAGR